MPNFARLTLMLLGAFVATGCASITASRTDMLSVNSNITGADVMVDGVRVAQAPAQIELDKKRPASVYVTAPGRTSHQCQTRMSAGGGYIVADVVLCILLFPLGCISFIDAGGAWNELEQPSCNAMLSPMEGRQPNTFGPEGRPLPPPPPPPL